MATLKTLEAQYGNTTVFNSAIFISLLRALDARFSAYTSLTESLEAKEKTLLQTGLDRLNDVVGPIAEQLLDYTTLGFLVAQSNTSQLLTVNTQPLFIVNDATQRALFTPSPYVIIERSIDTGTYAIAKTLGYNKSTGELQVLIKGAYGDIATQHTDWTITGSSGLSEVVRVLAEQANADTATVAAVKAAVIQMAADIQANLVTAGTLLTQTQAARDQAATTLANANAAIVTANNAITALNAQVADLKRFATLQALLF